MKYDFDKSVDRTGTHSVKTDVLPEGSPEDILPLWIADMDFPCAQPILDALHRRIDRRIFGYTEYDNSEVKNAIYSWFHTRHGWDIEKSQIFFCPGVVPAIAFLINILSEEGDGIIIQNPVYYPFANKITANKRTAVNNPLILKAGTYIIDYEDLENKFADPKNKGLILCSPHNPVGRVWTEDELLKIVSIAKIYDKWIISDEIHCDLTRKNVEFVPLLKAAPGYKDRIVVCSSPSKTFNIAGAHFSNIIIPNPGYQEKWTEFTSRKLSVTHSCNLFGLEAAIAAYTEGADWLDEARDYIDGNIQYAADYIKENLPKAVLCTCEGTYLLWIDARAYCADHKKLEYSMIHDAKLALDEGILFGEEGAGFERINVATPRANVMECMARLKKALTQIKQEQF